MNRKRFTRVLIALGPAVTAALAIAAQAGMAVHASPTLHAPAATTSSPHIAVVDGDWGPLNPHVLPVAGFNFTVNSPVLIELVGSGGTVAARAETTTHGAPAAGSLHTGAFRYGLPVTAGILRPGARLFAIDEATGLRSNTLTYYPHPWCKPYQCF